MITFDKKRSVPEKLFALENALCDDVIQPILPWLHRLSQRKCAPGKRFVAGTKVYTDKGLKNIEEIKFNDIVLSWNEKTKKMEYNRVLDTYVRQAEAIYKIRYSNARLIETTDTHPFYIVGGSTRSISSGEPGSPTGKWVEAKDLRVGDRSALSNDQTLEIVSIEIDKRTETVYNFQVENAHTYFVSEDAVLVHNADGYGATGNPVIASIGNLKIPITQAGMQGGIIAELNATLEAGTLTKKEANLLVSLEKSKGIKESYEKVMSEGGTLTDSEKANYQKSATTYLNAERDFSAEIVNSWKGKTEVPLTPYARAVMQAQFPEVDLSQIRLVQPGAVQTFFLRVLQLGDNMPMTIGNTVYNVGGSNSELPGGYDQIGGGVNSSYHSGDLGLLTHEITHFCSSSELSARAPKFCAEVFNRENSEWYREHLVR